MATTDVVARLQLRAEQFSSETGRAFAEMGERARSAAQNVRQEFNSSFAEVRKLAEQSLTMPRTAAGALDLSGEIASLRQAAAASDQTAIAMRELSIAQTAAASSARGGAEALRLEADASAVAALAAERDAAATRERIAALQAVQAELNQTASATRLHAQTGNALVVSARQQRAAMQQLGMQANDVAVQFAAGAPPMQIFAMQVSQVTQALQMMNGGGNKVLAFLGSFKGTLLTVAAVALTPFVAKLFEESEASKAAREAVEQHRKAVLDLADAQEKAIQTAERKQALDIANIKNELDAAVATRTRTQALLEQAQAQLQANLAQQRRFASEGGDGASAAAGAMGALAAETQRTIDGLTARLKTNAGEIQRLQKGIDLGFARLVGMKVDARSTPTGAVNTRYERLKSDAMQDPALQGDANAGRLAARLRELNLERDRELKRIEETTRRSRSASSGDRQFGRTIFSVEAAAIVRGIGGQVNSSDRSYAQQKRLYDDWVAAGRPKDNPVAKPGSSAHERGNALDIQYSAGLTIKKIKDAFAAEGVRLTKVIAERGHWHVEWAPSAEQRAAVRDAAKEVREAAQAQRELEASLEAITGKYNPATAAANRYREELAEIAKLQGAGKIDAMQAFSYGNAATENYRAGQKQAANDNFRRILGPENVELALGELDQRIRDVGQAWQDQAIEGARRVGDVLRDAAGGAADLLGARVSGPMARLLQPGGIERQAGEIADALGTSMQRVGVKIDTKSIDEIKGVLSGAAYGQLGGSVFASITGGKENKLTSSLGGILGKEAGRELGGTITKAVGGSLGKMLGGAAGPIGSILGGMLGGALGGLFTKPKFGTATVSGGGQGDVSASGSSKNLTQAATGLGSTVQSGLQSIADQLGATLGAFDVMIGVYKDKYRVRTSSSGWNGQGGLNFKGDSAKGLTDFGEDQAAAIKFAIADAIKDGAIQGVSAATQAILRSGQDIEKALQKALLIEAVPRDLKAMLDPVGAAIDALNAKFKKTVDALKEGGASAEQMAQAQRLYDLQLAQVKNSTRSASAELKDFLEGLKLGSNSPYSLRDQEAAAKAALDPFLAQIAAGQTIDQAKYQAAAQKYLDVERELYGSTAKFFEAMELVQGSTNRAIATVDNAVPVQPAVESPFAKATATAAEKTAAGVQTGNEMAQDTNDLLRQVVQQLQALGGSGGGGDFIGAHRNFVSAA